jgi:hypothetical protein
MGRKNSKHVKVEGIEYKRQITMVVSSAANDNILPFQVIFQDLILRSNSIQQLETSTQLHQLQFFV